MHVEVEHGETNRVNDGYGDVAIFFAQPKPISISLRECGKRNKTNCHMQNSILH